MSYQYQSPPQPLYQQPPPPRPSRLARFVAWIRRHPLISGVIGLALLIMIIVASIQNATAPAAPVASTPAVAVATSAPTAQPTHAPTQPAITHGTPLVGGKLSDFMGKYGTPNTQGVANSETWFLENGTVILNARPDVSGTVTYISVSGPASWSLAQSKAACTAYLPADATAFNSIGNLTDYHSSAGDIALNNVGSGVCTLSIASA